MPVTISSQPATAPSSAYSSSYSTTGTVRRSSTTTSAPAATGHTNSTSLHAARGRSPSRLAGSASTAATVASASRSRFAHTRSSVYGNGDDSAAFTSGAYNRFGQKSINNPRSTSDHQAKVHQSQRIATNGAINNVPKSVQLNLNGTIHLPNQSSAASFRSHAARIEQLPSGCLPESAAAYARARLLDQTTPGLHIVPTTSLHESPVQPPLSAAALTETATPSSSDFYAQNGVHPLCIRTDDRFLRDEYEIARQQVAVDSEPAAVSDQNATDPNNNSPATHRATPKRNQTGNGTMEDIKYIDSDDVDHGNHQQPNAHLHKNGHMKTSSRASPQHSNGLPAISGKVASTRNYFNELDSSVARTTNGLKTLTIATANGQPKPGLLPTVHKSPPIPPPMPMNGSPAVRAGTGRRLPATPTVRSKNALAVEAAVAQANASVNGINDAEVPTQSVTFVEPQPTDNGCPDDAANDNSSATTVQNSEPESLSATSCDATDEPMAEAAGGVRNASLRSSSSLAGKSTSPSRYNSWDRSADRATNGTSNGRSATDSTAVASDGLLSGSPSERTGGYLQRSSYGTNSSPSSDDSDGLCGLRNIGNTCFMNSVLQCLSNTRLLTEYLRDSGSDGARGTSAKDHRIFVEFAKLLRDMWSRGQRSVTPGDLKSAISSKHRMYSGCGQQDAQEFLRFLLDALHTASNTGRKGAKLEIDESLPDQRQAEAQWQWYTSVEKSMVQDLFVGQFKSSLKCTVCGHTSVTFDPFWDLSVPLPSSSRCKLESCLDLFIKEEVLDGDEMPTCAKCKKRQKSTKSFTIQRFPKYLVIHLKRFSETRWNKLTNIVEFPTGENGLDMAPYAAAGASSLAKYSLYGISNHMGSTGGGHYVASCKHPTLKKWHNFNDNMVGEMGENDLVSSSAYLLFYERA